jgi:hypothetical protein
MLVKGHRISAQEEEIQVSCTTPVINLVTLVNNSALKNHLTLDFSMVLPQIQTRM